MSELWFKNEGGILMAFSKEYVEQILWERDTAIAQLDEIGKGLGEKMDDVKTIVTARCDCQTW